MFGWLTLIQMSALNRWGQIHETRHSYGRNHAKTPTLQSESTREACSNNEATFEDVNSQSYPLLEFGYFKFPLAVVVIGHTAFQTVSSICLTRVISLNTALLSIPWGFQESCRNQFVSNTPISQNITLERLLSSFKSKIHEFRRNTNHFDPHITCLLVTHYSIKREISILYIYIYILGVGID